MESQVQLGEVRRASRYPKLQSVLHSARVSTMVNSLQRAVVLDRLIIEVEADDRDDAFFAGHGLGG